MLSSLFVAVIALIWVMPSFATSNTATILQTPPLAEKIRPRIRRSDDTLPPHVWALNVDKPFQSGHFCYAHAAQVKLWRQDSAKVDTLEVKKLGQVKPIKLRWPRQQTELTWPYSRLTLAHGATYLLRTLTNNTAISVIMHQVPANLTTVEQAEWMQQQGCDQQAQMLHSQQSL